MTFSVLALAGALFGAGWNVQEELPAALDLPDRPAQREALHRVATRSGLALPRESWPLSAGEARAFLERALARRPDALTRADSADLADLLGGERELWRGGPGLGGSWIGLNAWGAFSLSRADTATPEGPAGDLRREGSVGASALGSLGGWFWFRSEARIFTEWSENRMFWDRYDLADGEPSDVPLDGMTTDGLYDSRTGARYVAWAQWSNEWLSAKFGRDRVRFGPGLWTGLTTRLESPPYEQLDLRVRPYAWLSVQSTLLESRPDDQILTGMGSEAFAGDGRRWVQVHRFEVEPLRGLALAFQNQVAYSDSDGIQPAYLLPLVPIFFSQNLSGNTDNAGMQLDISLRRIPGVELWAAWNLDDLDGLGQVFGEHWLNRWAFLAGGRVLSPWRALDADLAAEFSVVRPWTYTGGRQALYTFAHYGLPMGSELGPDSRTWHVRASWRVLPSLGLALSGRVLEKGLGRQATLGLVHREGVDPTYADLFGNGKTIARAIEPEVSWEVFRDARLTGTWSFGDRRDSTGAEQSWQGFSLSAEADW